MARTLTDKLTTYQMAGARLTGCKFGMTLGNDWRIAETPAARTFYFKTPGSGPGYPGNREAEVRYPDNPGILYRTFGDFLDAWQPDTASSASRQHYIDTGLYLPVTAHAGEDGDDLPPAPELDALDRIREVLRDKTSLGRLDMLAIDHVLASVGR